MNKKDIKLMNATNTGNNDKSLVLRWVTKHLAARKKNGFASGSILDYGAGRKALHTKKLQSLGYNVYAYEIGDNWKKGIHQVKYLSTHGDYDLVYASNVINVQPSLSCLMETLREIKLAVNPKGLFVCNYPTPHKCNPKLKNKDIEDLLKLAFDEVTRSKIGSGFVFVCKKERDIT
jgi:hypothetical protein